MNRNEILFRVRSLGWPKNSYVVFGGAPLAIYGLREANDVDFLVSQELFEELKKAGWQELKKDVNDKPLVYDIFEAHKDWNFSSYSPTLQHLLQNAEIIEGIPIASLEEVRKWKLGAERPKDLADIRLIDEKLGNIAV